MITDAEAVERAAELGMLLGQDLAQARAQLNAEPATRATTTTVRQFLRANIAEVIAAIDDHEAHLEDWRSPVVYRCRCPFRGSREEWEQHLAERIAEKFDDHTELTLFGAVSC